MELEAAICRCCLKPSETMKNMLAEYLEISTVVGEVQILQIKTCFTNVCPEISNMTEQTSCICPICVDRLKTAYEFRQECLKADATLVEREPEISLVPKTEVEIKQEDIEPLEENSEFPTMFVKELDAEEKKETRKRKHHTKKSSRNSASVKKPHIDDDDHGPNEPTEEHRDLSDDPSDATFVCYYCDDLLATHAEFLQHREMHRTPGEWAIKRNCNLCAVEVKDYVKHLQETHSEYKPNVCHLCNKAFVVQRELKNHMLVHSDSKNFKCQSCSMAFKSLKALQSHILTKPNHLYYCIFCGGAETKINNILQHVQEKHPENRNKLMLPCYKCKKIFLSFPTLDSHKCADLKPEPATGLAHACVECNERFASADQLECHRMVCANRRNGSLHVCHVCQKEFPNRRKLIKHKSSAHRQKTFQCDKCGYATKSQSTLNVHTLKHADYPRFQCDFPGCTSRFKHPKGLRFHRDTHQTEACFECFLCEKRFQSLILIREHMFQHRMRSGKYVCEICSKVYKTKYNLAGHRAQHMGKRYTCDLCPNVYSNRSGLSVHKKNAHLRLQYQCRHCEQWFGQERSLFEHLFSHRGDKPWNCPNCRQGYLRKDKLFQCLECRKEFDCKRKLMRHKSSVHRDNSYCCDQCGYQTKTKSSLQIHTLTHSDDRPFHCDHPGCVGRFKNKVHLSAHKRIHGERLFECYICQKRCKTYVHIKRHMAQHCDKLKKHQCEICAKVYTEKYLLEVHVAGHIGKRMFACDQCPNTYMRRNALNMHRRSVHLKLGYECKFCDRWFAQDKSLVEHLFSHRGYKPWNCPVCRQGYVRRDKFKSHLRTHNIEYNEEVHGFKESSRSVLLSGLKVPQPEVKAPPNSWTGVME